MNMDLCQFSSNGSHIVRDGCKATVWSCSPMDVMIETNCPKGGDSGHGGVTSLTLSVHGAADMHISVVGAYGTEDRPLGDAHMITIVLGGDQECLTFIECLEEAARMLREQVANNQKTNGLTL